MSNKILIPIIVVLLLTVGGLSTYILVQKPSSSVVNSTVSSTAISSLTNAQIKSELSEKLAMIKNVLGTNQSIESSQAKGTAIVKGIIESNYKLVSLEVPPNLCFVSTNGKKYCDISKENFAPDSDAINSFGYEIADLPYGEYNFTIDFNELGFTKLPNTGSLLSNGVKFKVDQPKMELNIAPEVFEDLSNQKKIKVAQEFGNRPDCIKKDDFYYKCAGVGSPKPTN